MNRRTFLGVAASLTLADAVPLPSAPMPVIDTHIHLFDPTRPQGVPWPRQDVPAHQVMYQPSLPSRYRKVVDGLGIVGAIEIECSGWLEDNQWVLDVAKDDTIMVGTVGHLTPGTPEFKPNLERFHKNPLFRGIRYGLGRQGGKEFEKPEFVADLKALADADLTLDTANPSVALLADVVRVSDRVPNLRVVIDHLPQMLRPMESAARASYDASMKAFRDRPQIYVKVSEVLRKVDDKIPVDLAFYRPRLDEIVDVFGFDRVLYGSDWPNGDQWLPVPAGFKLVQEYFMGKGRMAAEKYFWRNSIKAYKWVKRSPNQPQA
jgi:predicted TIM-barrel fold metal-dependent hydrolase